MVLKREAARAVRSWVWIQQLASDRIVRRNSNACILESGLLIPAMVPIEAPLAASSWPCGALLVLPVLLVLFPLALRLAHNSGQRIANMLFGVFGSFAAVIALGMLTDIPKSKWLLEGNTRLVVASTTATIGAVIGIGIAVVVRRLLSLVRGVKRREPTGAELEVKK